MRTRGIVDRGLGVVDEDAGEVGVSVVSGGHERCASFAAVDLDKGARVDSELEEFVGEPDVAADTVAVELELHGGAVAAFDENLPWRVPEQVQLSQGGTSIDEHGDCASRAALAGRVEGSVTPCVP